MSANIASKKKVLVVDDDSVLRKNLSRVISGMGFEVREAKGGNEAFDMMRIMTFDLVVTDINMPEGDGITLVEKSKAFWSTPFIVMTGLTTLGEAQRACIKGVKHFLAKPFDLGEFKSILQRIIEGKDTTKKPSQELIQVHLDDFIRGEELMCGAYLRTGRSDFTKISHGGEKLSSNEIAKCHLEGINSLYILKSDFKKVLDLKPRFFADADESVRQKKREYFSQVSRALVLLRDLEELNPELFIKAQITLESTLSILVDHIDLLNELKKKADENPDKLISALKMAMTTLMLAKTFTDIGPVNFFYLASAAFLHDYGDNLCHPKTALTTRKCVLSVNALGKIPEIPQQIFRLLLLHHNEDSSSKKEKSSLECLRLADTLFKEPFRHEDLLSTLRNRHKEILKTEASSYTPVVLKVMKDLFDVRDVKLLRVMA